MTASNFAQAIALVLASEGGFVNDPLDPGGATNLGITLATLRVYRGRATSVADVKALGKDEAGLIYRRNYWDAVKADQLPPGVDYAVFDFAVNSGPATAAKHMQACLSIIEDGVVGPLTLKAAYQVRSADLIASLCAKRLVFLKGLPTWSRFGAGWSARVARVQADALRMAANPIPQPQTHDQPVLEPAPPLKPLPPKQPDDPGTAQPQPASSGFFDALGKIFAAVWAAIFPKA